jgi:polar amino acid transport system substrate-binding protein
VARTELRVYRRRGTTPIGTKDGLAGKDVITILGYSYAGLLSFIKDPANHVDNNTAATHDTAFTMLERGRADYLLDYTGPATEVLTADPGKDVEYEVISRLEVFLVLSRSYPDAKAVMARLDAIIPTLHRPNGK